MAFKVRVRSGVSIKRVVSKIAVTLIMLWVGGVIVDTLGDTMNGTTSPFYQGLTLIGWTVATNGTITGTTGSGVLTVIGLVGIASVVLEFLDFNF